MGLTYRNKFYNKISKIRRSRMQKIAAGPLPSSEAGIILRHLLIEHYGIESFSYLDLGCSDPIAGSITHDFYKTNCPGVCVDANPIYAEKFKKARPRDLFINVGVTDGIDGEEKDFYELSNKVSSTFDKQWAITANKKLGSSIERVIKIKLININRIIEENFNKVPDLLLLDLEGFDFRVLRTLKFDEHRPKVIMLETLALPYDRNKIFDNCRKTAMFLKDKRYRWICSLNENSIFINQDNFTRRSFFRLV